MKRILIFFASLFCVGSGLWAEQSIKLSALKQSSQQEQRNIHSNSEYEEYETDESQKLNPASGDIVVSAQTLPEQRKVKLITADHEFYVTIYDNITANAFYDMIPIELNFEDFNNVEKIAFLERELPVDDESDGFAPKAGDVCLYVPWGNISIFYKDFRYSDDLVPIGHIDSDIKPIISSERDFSASFEKTE